MTHSLRRFRSRFEWFRMDVPQRHRARVGKTSWQESLHTSDPALAAIRRAELSARYKRLVQQLDDEIAALIPAKVAAYVDACLGQLADCNGGSLDRAVAELLCGIADKVRASWSPADEDAIDDRRSEGVEDGIFLYETASQPLLVFDRDADRELYLLRERMLEGRGVVDGMVYQDLVRLLRARCMWQAAPLFLLPFIVPDEDGLTARHVDLVGDILFARLADHRFTSWPENAVLAFPSSEARVVETTAISDPPFEPVPRSASRHRGLSGPTVVEAFAAWRSHTKARIKTQDEFGSAIDRFVSAFGDMPVAVINRRTVREFRNLLQSLPARASSEIRDLPPREQAKRAEKEKMRLLSPTTVKKQLQALYTTLSHARDEMDATVASDAFGVSVDCSEVMGDERLAFSGDQLRALFSTADMTSNRMDDAAFWFMLLGPLTGCRIEEIAQLRPGDVREEDGVCFIDIRRESVRERRARSGERGLQKRVKTRTSLRRVPLHPVLIEAGFAVLADRARIRGDAWLFDLRAYEKYEQRGKYMSNKLNRLIDRAGITDPEFVYHSFRHSLKATLRELDTVKEEISDLLTGHSFAISIGRKYGRGAGLKTLQRAITQIAYPSVDWSPVIAAGRSRLL